MRTAVQVTAAVFLAMTSCAAEAEPRWPPPDAGYIFVPAPGCDRPRPTAPGEACADQMAVFVAARADAAASGKALLVIFGATWCPSCKGLRIALPEALSEAGLAQRVHVVDITLSTLDRGKITPVPSGDAVRADLLRARPDFKQRAIPFFAFIAPETGLTSARNLDDLEQNGTWSRKGLAHVLKLAQDEAHGGQAAPTEPSWLTRKWRRWFGY
jgi:thiol-disulfide isomerase/thioredoxin